MYSSQLVMWSESEIKFRESLIEIINRIVQDTITKINKNIKFTRVETSILTPESVLESHIIAKMNMFSTTETDLYLRPETTSGTYNAFDAMFPNNNQKLVNLPMCIWQAGKSFRHEKNEGARASKLRLFEFYQLEFQVLCPDGTKANYILPVLEKLIQFFGGKIVKTSAPHYSKETLDWEIKGIEVASCSFRTDFRHGECQEISIGLDRLVKILWKK